MRASARRPTSSAPRARTSARLMSASASWKRPICSYVRGATEEEARLDLAALLVRERGGRGEPALVPADRVARDEEPPAAVARHRRVPCGASRVVGELEVVGEDLGVLLLATRCHVLDPDAARRVRFRAPRPGDARVRDVAGEHVDEEELALAFDRRARAFHDEPALDERVDRAGVAAEARDGACPERPSHHRRPLQRRLLVPREPVDAGGDHALDGVGQGLGRRPRERPAAVLEQRASRPPSASAAARRRRRDCPRRDAARRRRPRAVPPCRGGGSSARRSRRRERRQLDHRAVARAAAPRGVLLEELAAAEAEERRRRARARTAAPRAARAAPDRPSGCPRSRRAAGRPSAIASKYARHAPTSRRRATSALSGTLSSPRMPTHPRIARCASMASLSVPSMASRLARALTRMSAAGSLSRIPASDLRISPSGQNASPLPYGRQRPAASFSSGCRSRASVANSRASRLLPIPAGPRTVISCARRSRTVRREQEVEQGKLVTAPDERDARGDPLAADGARARGAPDP